MSSYFIYGVKSCCRPTGVYCIEIIQMTKPAVFSWMYN